MVARPTKDLSRALLLASCLTFLQATTVLGDGPAPERNAARFELRFMTMMIDHHAMAIEMATLCVEKSTREELRDLCQTMIGSQQQEIATMQQWLGDWYDVAHEPRMDANDRRQLAKLAALEEESFDIEFMLMMIHHHSIAVERSMMCLGRAFHAPLEALCESIITAQLEEIFKMRSWVCQWYGVCRVSLEAKSRATH